MRARRDVSPGAGSHLPGRVRDELRRRHEQLTALAGGPVVELATLGRPGTPLPSGRFDVVGVLTLATAADPAALVRAARAVLPPDGRLLLFEPYRRARWVGAMTDAVAPLVRRVTHVQVNLPVPALVREAGFVTGTVERVSMPTPLAPLRPFCLIVGYPAASSVAAPAAAGPVRASGERP